MIALLIPILWRAAKPRRAAGQAIQPDQDVVTAEKLPVQPPGAHTTYSSAEDMDFDIVSTRG